MNTEYAYKMLASSNIELLEKISEFIFPLAFVISRRYFGAVNPLMEIAMIVMVAAIACSLSSLNPTDAGLWCYVPPQGSSEECAECYIDECADFFADWENCESLTGAAKFECRQKARERYEFAINICDNLLGCNPAMNPSDSFHSAYRGVAIVQDFFHGTRLTDFDSILIQWQK